MTGAAAGGPIRTESCDITNEPSDEELIPCVSREDLAARSSSKISDSDWDENQNGQRAEFLANPSTPERAGSPPDALLPRRQKVPGQDERKRGDRAFVEITCGGKAGYGYHGLEYRKGYCT